MNFLEINFIKYLTPSIIDLVSVAISSAAISNLVIVTLKLFETKNAERELKKIMNREERIELRKKYILALREKDDIKLGEIEEKIKEESQKLKNKKEKQRIFEALDNNTETGKKRYISHLLAF